RFAALRWNNRSVAGQVHACRQAVISCEKIDVRGVQGDPATPSPEVWPVCNRIAAPMTIAGVPAAAPMATPENAGTRLPALRARLRATQVRSRIGSMLRGAVFSLVAALALLCGLEVFGLHFDIAAPVASLSALSERPLSYFAFSGVAFAGALLLAIVLAFLLTPDIATLARAADHTLALQERLSTALEVDTSPQPHAALGPVPSALLADAERHAATIDPRQIVRLDLPRAIWAVPM